MYELTKQTGGTTPRARGPLAAGSVFDSGSGRVIKYAIGGLMALMFWENYKYRKEYR